MSKTRAEIDAEYEDSYRRHIDVFASAYRPHEDIFTKSRQFTAAIKQLDAKRDAALAALGAAERAAAEKGKP